MKTNSPRTWLGAILVTLAAVAFVTQTGWLVASPSEDIAKAVKASGASSVKQANANQFLDAVASVLVGIDKQQSKVYVAAAVQARPDLRDQIAATAVELSSGGEGADGTDTHVSGHKQRCTICHKGKNTLTLPCKAAQNHLQNHPQDYSGPCIP